MIPQDIEIKIARHARKISDRAIAMLYLLRLDGTLTIPNTDGENGMLNEAAIKDLVAAGLAPLDQTGIGYDRIGEQTLVLERERSVSPSKSPCTGRPPIRPRAAANGPYSQPATLGQKSTGGYPGRHRAPDERVRQNTEPDGVAAASVRKGPVK
jgi:hypothetical protein